MRIDRQSRWWLRLQGLLFTALFLLVLILLAWLSTRYTWEADLSSSARQPLPEATMSLLEQVNEPLTITAFVRPDDVLYGHIVQLAERYRRHQPNIELQMVNPDARPDLVRELGVEGQGEMVVEFGGRRERVQVPSEPRLSAALQRVLRGRDQPLLHLAGQGERHLRGEANHDLGAFGEYLAERGHQLQEIQPAGVPGLPAGAEGLILAGPRSALLPDVQNMLTSYLDAGGNLLWLVDDGDADRLAFLAEYLGLQLLPGLVVEPRAEELLGVDDPRLLVVDDYADHPALHRLQGVSLLSGVQALDVSAEGDSGWQVEVLLRSEARHWNETGDPDDPVLDEAAGEQRGPLMLGLSLRRPHPQNEGEQRIAVMGDADFLSNAYIGNGANLNLGVALVDWLSAAETAGMVAGQAAPDQRLRLSQTSLMVMGFGLLLGLPGLFLSIAGWLWWRRRRS